MTMQIAHVTRFDSSRRRRRRHYQAREVLAHAFTLIELLVVIAIIGVLIAILLPALGKSRQAAKATQCLANQRSIGMAMSMYAGQYRDVVPREGVELIAPVPIERRRAHLPWPIAFRPFLDDNASPHEDTNDRFINFPFYRCPSRTPDAHNIHFVVNAMRFRAPETPDTRGNDWRYRKWPTFLGNVTRPASTIYITDFFDDPRGVLARELVGARNDMAVAQFYDLWHPEHVTMGGPVEVLLIDRISPRRHGSGANAVFLDGHAQFVKSEVLTTVNNWDDGDYTLPRLR